MPRGRPKKNQTTTETDQQIETLHDFALEFAKSLKSSTYNPVFFNPIWQNDLLKNINMSPHSFDRDKIEKLIANPKANEDALKDLAQYLYNVIMQFNKLVNYYATILTFDYFTVSTNADEEDMKTSNFKKARKKNVEWVEKLNPKLTFPNVMKGVLLEDVKFYYVRETEDSVTLQEMPSKYCKIVAKTEYGYQYAFNMYYFLQAGVNIRDFSPDFIGYFNDFIQNKKKTNNYFYWQTLDPVKAPVFKFDETRAGLTPPLMGLFLDSAEIDAYKKLFKTKTQLEVWKLILAKIPLKDNQKGAKTMNDFAIDPTTAAKFTTMMETGVPEGVKVITTPLEAESIDFAQSQNKDNIVGYGQQNFYDSAGTSPTLFGAQSRNGTGLKASIVVDEMYVLHMYRQFERFINAYLKLYKKGRYRFKVIFPDITRFNWQEKAEQFLKAAQYGYSKTLVSVALGINPDDMQSLLVYENSIELLDKFMRPLSSSHVQKGTNEGGRPRQSKVSDAGDKTRDHESNESKRAFT